jgi:hypothetical protein
MTPDKKKTKPPDQYEPSAGPGYLTPAQFQDMASFFYKLGESRSAQTLAVLAGIGAVLEGLHVIWLGIIWVVGRLP